MSIKSTPFTQAWLRGLKVVVMYLATSCVVWLCVFPVSFLPTNWQPCVGWLVLILVAPLLSYWALLCFYPHAAKPEPQEDQTPFAPKVCFSCTAPIPSGLTTCSACGWTFKAPKPQSAQAM